MKITNGTLIDILLWSWINPNELIESLSVVWKLLKRFWKLLYTSRYIDEISNIDNNISNLVSILKKTNKIQYNDIKNMVNIIKIKSKDYLLEFTINSSSADHNKDIQKYIDSKFHHPQTHIKLMDEVWVNISWESWYYKKTLDSDLEKILS